MRPVRIVVADDHPIVLKGVLGLFAGERDIDVVEACTDGGSARDAILRHDPDVAILDVRMPVLTGTEVLAEICRSTVRTRVIFLTASASDTQLLAAIASGARGIILKDMAADDLLRCLHVVASGGRWLPREILDRALEAETPRTTPADTAYRGLTPREREISLLVASGLSNKDIGRKLNVSDGTVKVHLNNIFQKVGVSNRTALAALAIACREPLTRQ